MGTPAQVYGTPTESAPGTPAQVYGTPHASEPQEETAMVPVTISATDPDAIAAAIDALRRNPTVAVEPERSDPPPLSVLPGGRSDAARRRRPA